jgi:hypothetical protein
MAPKCAAAPEYDLNMFFIQILRDKKYHVVFLQEVWFKKDYDFLVDCLHHIYHISDFDPDCARELIPVSSKPEQNRHVL